MFACGAGKVRSRGVEIPEGFVDGDKQLLCL